MNSLVKFVAVVLAIASILWVAKEQGGLQAKAQKHVLVASGEGGI